jgi:hypothetical protein
VAVILPGLDYGSGRDRFYGPYRYASEPGAASANLGPGRRCQKPLVIASDLWLTTGAKVRCGGTRSPIALPSPNETVWSK